jgi:PKD repeat protein
MSQSGVPRSIVIVAALVVVAVAGFLLIQPRNGGQGDTVNPDAVAGEDITITLGENVQLDASASTDNLGITSYAWDLGDGDMASGESVEHVYSGVGDYTVTLTVEDKAGNSDTDALTVHVVEPEDETPPIADAGTDIETVVGAMIVLDASGSSDNIGITEYLWDLGDGDEATGVTIEHFYTAVGEYAVVLTVEDEAGNSDTDTLIITVEEAADETPPGAEAGPDQDVLVSDQVAFDGSGSGDDIGIVLYSWDFDDGDTATGMHVTHSFDEAGVYTVTLEVSDAARNTATDTLLVTVAEGEPADETPPTAEAGPDQEGVVGEAIHFDGSGSTDDVDIEAYLWSFGDGASAEGAVVEHAYDAVGEYTVTLTVTDEAENPGEDTLTVTITEAETAPTIDGVIDLGEYPHEFTHPVTDVTIHWYNDAEEIYIGLESPGTGWVAIGFDPVAFMRGANLIFCYVEDGEAFVSDQYGSGSFSHQPDTNSGGTEDITDYAGVETSGGTIFEFRMLLDTGDEYDNPLSPGGSHTALNSVQMTSDSLTAKHSRKGAFAITLDD